MGESRLRRRPGAQIASSRVAVDKARTAAIFVRPSREIEQQVSSGRLGALALHGARALTGGIPLKVGDEVVGAIGTSGETPDEDEAISLAAAAGQFSTATVPALTYEGARRAAESVAHECSNRGVAPVCAVVDAGGEPAACRRRADAGGERWRLDGQGTHRSDLSPAKQGLRGPGRGRKGVGASPGAGGAASGAESRSSMRAR